MSDSGWAIAESLGSVFGAIGTVSAVAIALWQSRKETRIRLEKEKRAQAESISIWVEERDWSVNPGIPAEKPSKMPHFQLGIQNLSNTPVYNVVATVVTLGDGEFSTGEGFYGTETKFRPQVTFPVLPSGNFKCELWGPYQYGEKMNQLVAEIAFTDSSEVHWIRRGTGTLNILEDEPYVPMGVYEREHSGKLSRG